MQHLSIMVINGSLQGTRYDIDRECNYVIGRASECDLSFSDVNDNSDISRRHCLLHVESPRAWITDLNSKNGTFVNERRIGASEYELNAGDEIRLGRLLLRLDLREPADLIASAYGWAAEHR